MLALDGISIYVCILLHLNFPIYSQLCIIYIYIYMYINLTSTALQAKLNEEKSGRQRAELLAQEKERQTSMLSVDYRQIQQRLQKLEGEHRQEVEKVKVLQGQVEQEQQKRNVLQTDLAQQSSEAGRLRAREQQLAGEVAQLREAKCQIEEELHHLKTQRNVDQLQTKELQEQLEAEAYFSVNSRFTQTVVRQAVISFFSFFFPRCVVRRQS